jgi:hypothetical protein
MQSDCRLFVDEDSLNFQLVQIAVAVILIASIVMLIAYRQQLTSFFSASGIRRHNALPAPCRPSTPAAPRASVAGRAPR